LSTLEAPTSICLKNSTNFRINCEIRRIGGLKICLPRLLANKSDRLENLFENSTDSSSNIGPSTAINAVAAYCKFQEGGAVARPRKRPPTRRASPTLVKEEASPQLVAAAAEKQALNAAMLSVF